tara:strand:- start:2163 stop:2573 length:411 start_codon:yes stop_codon:yes gene_type:complete
MEHRRRLFDPVRVLDALDSFEGWNARQSPWLRIPLGLLLCLGGILSILPFVGLWMLPLGLLVLSEDVPFIRDRRDRLEGWLRRILGERQNESGCASNTSAATERPEPKGAAETARQRQRSRDARQASSSRPRPSAN